MGFASAQPILTFYVRYIRASMAIDEALEGFRLDWQHAQVEGPQPAAPAAPGKKPAASAQLEYVKKRIALCQAFLKRVLDIVHA